MVQRQADIGVGVPLALIDRALHIGHSDSLHTKRVGDNAVEGVLIACNLPLVGLRVAGIGKHICRRDIVAARSLLNHRLDNQLSICCGLFEAADSHQRRHK